MPKRTTCARFCACIPRLRPYKCAVLPLQKNLSEKADEIYALMRKKFSATYDLTGSIGKRYRRQDEIGTPYCVTVDFQTLEDGTVTVRDRDSMEPDPRFRRGRD